MSAEAEIMEMLNRRTDSAREALEAMDTTGNLEFVLRELMGAIECIRALLISAEPAPVLNIMGEPVALPEPKRSPQDRAFRKIAAFVGSAGYEPGVDASSMMTQIAEMIAAAGLPHPLHESSETHYRSEAFRVLTRAERRMLGIRGAK